MYLECPNWTLDSHERGQHDRDPTGIELLRKIWARTSSPFAPEAAIAREKAAAFVAKYGMTVADIPNLPAPKAKTSGPKDRPASPFMT
jgi:hypothetical protein